MKNYVRSAKDALRRSEGSPNIDLARLAKCRSSWQIDWVQALHTSPRRAAIRCTIYGVCGLIAYFTVGIYGRFYSFASIKTKFFSRENKHDRSLRCVAARKTR